MTYSHHTILKLPSTSYYLYYTRKCSSDSCCKVGFKEAIFLRANHVTEVSYSLSDFILQEFSFCCHVFTFKFFFNTVPLIKTNRLLILTLDDKP
jgi:hypothetical protein